MFYIFRSGIIKKLVWRRKLRFNCFSSFVLFGIVAWVQPGMSHNQVQDFYNSVFFLFLLLSVCFLQFVIVCFFYVCFCLCFCLWVMSKTLITLFSFSFYFIMFVSYSLFLFVSLLFVFVYVFVLDMKRPTSLKAKLPNQVWPK